MTPNKLRVIALLPFVALSLPLIQSTATHAEGFGFTSKETLRKLSSYRAWGSLAPQPFSIAINDLAVTQI